MPDIPAALPALLLFAVALLALAGLSRLISLRVHATVYLLTRAEGLAVAAYFLLMLPGIFVHEAAHWIVAKLLGLRPGRFTIWPKRHGRMVTLGSVTMRSGGIWLDSLVGIAPLVAGTILVALLARGLFTAAQLDAMMGYAAPQAAGRPDLMRWLDAIGVAVARPDSAVRLYLIFTIANGMMPSAPDREPVKPVLVYIALAAALYLIAGLPLDPLANALAALVAPLMRVNAALVITVLLDLVVFAALTLAYWLADMLFGS
jgi:hypothetical protein